MHKRTFDLNLLLVFQALMQHRSVTRAAADLGLTQPAVSHAIQRLRENFKDPLFVRAKKGIQPTIRAVEMAEPIADALEAIFVTVRAPFNPTSLRRTFRVGLVGYGAFHL